MNTYNIRPIGREDNMAVKYIVQKVLVDLGAPKVGTAYEDKSLEDMYAAYQDVGYGYFVLEEDGKVIGGAGIGPLEDERAGGCELQKMYFLEEARGKGYGKRMIGVCLEEAKKMGYTYCYLETMPYMEAAQKMYQKIGFTYLDKPMGNTGHCACPVWMIKEL